MDDGDVDALPPVQGTLTYSLLRAAAAHRTAITRAFYEWDLTATQYLVLVSPTSGRKCQPRISLDGGSFAVSR